MGARGSRVARTVVDERSSAGRSDPATHTHLVDTWEICMIKGRIAKALASTALVLGGAMTVAPSAVADSGSSVTALPASSDSALASCWGQRVTGSAGHQGNKTWCDSGRYREVIKCETLGGYQYTHYGPWVWASAESVAWCNLGDRIIGDYAEWGA
ncbi:hypothetical protein D0Z67_27485 [Streptomyces seoulensis]|uniref:Uncharacterized protein n=2 Tax=Streptomyces seoulensis TaxID=73044 RepID=A0A4P6U2V3_STRSO|nr:hypothetical protein D0Z67_27485 [Streptomyces seoulensis]